MVDHRSTIERAIEILEIVVDGGMYDNVYDEDNDRSYSEEIYECIVALEQMYSEMDNEND
jgi:hypothetical protein